MKLEIDEKEGKVTVTLPLVSATSKSGKSTILASTFGNKSVTVNGREVKMGVNIYVPKGQ